MIAALILALLILAGCQSEPNAAAPTPRPTMEILADTYEMYMSSPTPTKTMHPVIAEWEAHARRDLVAPFYTRTPAPTGTPTTMMDALRELEDTYDDLEARIGRLKRLRAKERAPTPLGLIISDEHSHDYPIVEYPKPER